MAAKRYANPGDRVLDSAGNLLSNGKLYFYSPGTETEKAIYTTSALSVERANPVILSGTGLIPEIWLDGAYDVVLKNQNDVLIDDGDNINLTSGTLQITDWSASVVYAVDDIVRGSDDNIYISSTANNLNNNPTTTVGTNWEYFSTQSVVLGLTAGTTQTQGGATAMTASINEFSTVANPNDGGALPDDTAIGERVMVVNNGAEDLKVWPADGDSINDGATDAADSAVIASGGNRIYTKQTATKWVHSDSGASITVGTNFVSATSFDAGDPMALNSDGTVSEVTGTTETNSAGTAAVFESAAIDYTSVIYVGNNKIVAAYKLDSNDYIYAVVGTVSGSGISFGTPVAINEAQTFSLGAMAYDSANDRVVVAYRSGVSSGVAKVGTVSGTSISFGSAVEFAAVNALGNNVVYDSTNGKVVIAYEDNTDDTSKAVVGTVSGSSISFGTPVEFDPDNTSTNMGLCFDSANDKVIISFNKNTNGALTVIVGTVSGTSISFGTAVTCDSAPATDMSATFDTDNGKVIIAYGDSNNSDYGTAVVGTVSGASISFGTPVVFESAALDYVSCVYNSDSQRVEIYYDDQGNSSYGTYIVGTVSGTDISFGTAAVFESADSNFITAARDTDSDKTVVCYEDVGNSQYGTGVVVTTEGDRTNARKFIGFAQNSGGNTDEAEIFTDYQIDTNQSGLTQEQEYWIEYDGTLETSETGYPKAGTAFGTDKIQVGV